MTDDGSKGTRRGLVFVAKAVIIGTAAVVALAIAGDDELRGSLVSWAKSPDRLSR